MKRNPYLHIRRIIVDPKPQPKPSATHVSHLPNTRAEPEPVALTAKQARANERRAARKRVADAPSEPNGSPGAAPRLSGTKAEWAHAQRNVDGGSAPCRLTVEEVQKQNEAASAWAERAERAWPKETTPPRPASISTSTRRRGDDLPPVHRRPAEGAQSSFSINGRRRQWH